MSENKFEKQLKALLDNESSVENLVDSLEDGDQPIAEVQDLIPVVFEHKETKLAIQDNDTDLLDDYKFVRSNLYGLIGRSNAALDLILKIASMSEHPRAIEVAANILKTSADISKDLLQLQKVIQEKSTKGQEKQGKYVQNNFYTAPTKDVSDILDNLDDE